MKLKILNIEKIHYIRTLMSSFFYVKKVSNIKDIRCPNCNQLLLKAEVVKGEIKCLRCRKIIKIDTSKTELRATH